MGGRALLIGKRATVLTRLAAALREAGIDADLTQDVSGTDTAGLSGYDAVAFGRAVGQADRARMKEACTTANPDVVFVDGLAPITPLLVTQFEQTLDRRPAAARTLAAVTPAGPGLTVELRSPADVSVTGYGLTRLYQTRIAELPSRRLAAGAHLIPLDPGIVRAREAFAVVRADTEVQAMSLPRPLR